MVGTSLFENYLKENSGNGGFKDAYMFFIKNKTRAEAYEDEESRVRLLKKSIDKWIDNNENASAEIKSLIKLKDELKDDFQIYFLYSDTLLGRLASEILKEKITSFISGLEKVEAIHIRNLQVWDRKEFNKGMSNLISKIYEIAQDYWDNLVINITGGYKATIPYLAILAQFNQCPIYYIFEDTDALIKIPNIPLSKEWLDWNKLAEYEEKLRMLEKGIYGKNEFEKIRNSEFYKEFSFLIWEESINRETIAELNPIGKIIFEKYKEKYFSFYCTQEVSSEIDTDERLKKLIKNQFCNEQIRKNKTEEKNGHLVYDAGDNQLRIFYREREGYIFVYKVFNNHQKYEEYLKKAPYSEDLINQKFILRKIKKEA